VAAQAAAARRSLAAASGGAVGIVRGAAIVFNPVTGHSVVARLFLISLVLILMGDAVLLVTPRNTRVFSEPRDRKQARPAGLVVFLLPRA
jgi:hypothetical protein